jgi:hypothetical protein
MVLWLVYHAHYQVLICTIHRHAILNVAIHLADKHKDVDRKSRRAIVTDCLGLQLSQPSNAEISVMDPGIPPQSFMALLFK